MKCCKSKTLFHGWKVAQVNSAVVFLKSNKWFSLKERIFFNIHIKNSIPVAPSLLDLL
jgi:hypothetical protein